MPFDPTPGIKGVTVFALLFVAIVVYAIYAGFFHALFALVCCVGTGVGVLLWRGRLCLQPWPQSLPKVNDS